MTAVASRPTTRPAAQPDGGPRTLPAVVGADLVVPTLRGPRTYAPLDHAASTPALVAVQDAVDVALRTYSSVHRGNGWASRVTSEWYEQAREEIGRFVGARDDDTVVVTRNTTDSLNLLAHCLPVGTTVVVFETEHHAALLPWEDRPGVTVSRLAVPRTVDGALDALDRALAAVSTPYALVVVAGASNVTGEVWPLERVVDTARAHGARVALDAAQLAPHRRVDLAATGVDWVALSGHKLYAPYGAGALVGRADWLDEATPYLRGGGATARVTPLATTWARGAARHEAGSPNVIGAVALAAACATVERHRDAVESHEQDLLDRLRDGLGAVPGVDTWTIFGDDPQVDRVGVVAFTVDRLDSALVSAVLSAEHGIGVRDGRFCAHVLVDDLLTDPWGDVPGTAVRASVGLAATVEHVERLVAAVAELAAHGPQRRWVRGEQGWVAEGDHRETTLPRPW
ncbi:aminotransferase class V-fold PLP-dependent enzyme [Lapillicoccus jejuensis]|uniref:Selenocysteine lyase/cysteine desulfurase n=1 Tax=Lapillicoccus jejuensis TaxID=402171 RepID=A0A542E401_9MICO|nr:aminotransferase class V-fold PLP-dependent enzyme [Lapillicoccus jejuensis]TQJ10047.1 selenocysteine lyase/cysteine desulfurase [Lapillicoccus jejuensis]